MREKVIEHAGNPHLILNDEHNIPHVFITVSPAIGNVMCNFWQIILS